MARKRFEKYLWQTLRQSVDVKCLCCVSPWYRRGFDKPPAGEYIDILYQQKEMEALRIVAQHMHQNDVDEFMIFCYFAPCIHCDECSDFSCIRCDEIAGYEYKIQKQLIRKAIISLCKNESLASCRSAHGTA